MQQMDDPPYLSVGTEVSAKYKGAFCEAKVRKVVRNIKCKVAYKHGLGSGTVSDDQVKGDILRVGALVEVKHPDRRDYVEATITKIQDCSQYTVVFDDGDITTLRRSALCLKSGRHFNESETLDQLPLTHPEHFGNPVIGGRRGRSCRSRQLQDDSSEEEEEQDPKEIQNEKEEHIGKVVCVESTDTKKKGPKENWFPALVVSPTTQETVRIRVKDEYLVRSFKDGRYYTVPKKEANEFTREMSHKQEGTAIMAALEYLDSDILPPHWDRDALFGLGASSSDFDQDFDSDSSDDEPREEKDHFVAQLYKYMDDRGTPLNKGPSIINRDVDLYRLFRAVHKLGGYNRVTSQNQWKSIAMRLGFSPATTSITNLVKQAYKKFLQPFEEFNRKLGCTMVAHPRANRIKGRSLVRANSVASPKPTDPKEIIKPSSSLASITTADESENNSESGTDTVKLSKRKLSTGSTTGKVKALVDKFEQDKGNEKVKEKEENIPIVNLKAESIATPTTARGIVSKLVYQKNIESHSYIQNISKKEKEREMKEIEFAKEKEKEREKEKEKEMEKERDKEKEREKEKEKLNITTSSKLDSKPFEKRSRKKKEIEIEKPEKTEKLDKLEKSEKKDHNPTTLSSNKEPPDSTQTNKDFPIEVGDKLKVYYHEQKVTYEAKVIEITDQQGTPLYLVHYTGWNTRYDEWVPKERVAENLSNSKTKRTKNNSSRGNNNSTGPSSTPTSSNSNKFSGKRGRGGSRSDSQPPRSTTPSSVASNSSRTKSPATPAQRRTTRGQPSSQRRASNNTDISSIQTDSDTDSDEPVKKPSNRTLSLNSNSSGKNTATNAVQSSMNTNTSTALSINNSSRSGSSQDEETFAGAKGRDYDLNQIRSELKGFKEIKSPSPDAERMPSLIPKTELEIKQEITDDKSTKNKTPENSITKNISNRCETSKNTSSDVSSDSDSLGGDDDSQSSIDVAEPSILEIPKFENKFKIEKSITNITTPLSKPSTSKPLSKFVSNLEKAKDSKSILEIIKAEKMETKKTTTLSNEFKTGLLSSNKEIVDCKKWNEPKKEEEKSSIFLNKISEIGQKTNIIEKIQSLPKIEKTITNVPNSIQTITTSMIQAIKPEKKPLISEKSNRDKILTSKTIDKPTMATPVIPLSILSVNENKRQSSLSDIYEFKEPEPFELETSTTPSKKPTMLQSFETTVSPSPLSAEKRNKQVLLKNDKINELKASTSISQLNQLPAISTPVNIPHTSITSTPISTIGKRKKTSPIKEKDVTEPKISKLVKKEDSILSQSIPIVQHTHTPSQLSSSSSSSDETVFNSSNIPLKISTPSSTSSSMHQSSTSSFESTFDVLRKSPSFNMRGGVPIECPSSSNNSSTNNDSIITTVKSTTTGTFGEEKQSFEQIKFPKLDQLFFDENLPSTSTSILSHHTNSSILLMTCEEQTLSKNQNETENIEMKDELNDSSQSSDLSIGKELEPFKKLLDEPNFVDLEPPKIDKLPSIADKVLKALNQQNSAPDKVLKTLNQQNSAPISASVSASVTNVNLNKILLTENKKTIDLCQPSTSSHYQILQPNIIPPCIKHDAEILRSPKHNINVEPMQSSISSKIIETPSINIDPYPKKSIINTTLTQIPSTLNPTDILESISPKNNDLSETIQKLESVIKKTTDQPTNIDNFNDDSSESTDSEQRLYIEDESNDIMDSTTINNLSNSNTNPTSEPELNNFSSLKFHQENTSIFSNAGITSQQSIIHQSHVILDKQQMNAVEFLTTGMIDRENERLLLLSASKQAPTESILNQAITNLNHPIISKKENECLITNPLMLEPIQNEPISMLLCEETIPGSPASVCGNTIINLDQPKKAYEPPIFINPHPTSSDIKPVPMEIEIDLTPQKPLIDEEKIELLNVNINTMICSNTNNTNTTNTGSNNNNSNNSNNESNNNSDNNDNGVGNVVGGSTSTNASTNVAASGSGGGTSSSSPRDSISPDDSKSEGESDMKKQDLEQDNSGITPKKRRRPRKSSEYENNGNPNNSSASKRRKISHMRKHTNGSDSDDNNSDTIAIQQRNPRRSPKPCQFNFLVQLDASLTSQQRINILRKKIQELRKTYNSIKAELASIDRRRKKLRRREREKNKLAKAGNS